ncbi:acyl-CoA N-acyltransferase [Pseudovirgaria hyperparasitica]|uniref:Acyl-CoA N-acyltransferase n=1 Tax=Pseudovirgaria hyperparasitica TaxID=470096 RepID=A0A6A6WFT3_9PEZI|nr:acyl-CoA N-acyltransferase [Pseudovirgaria hyperparasitica]KAF2761039.1 acyl-CoA N-acyltransferase [Pseudovirgaria hyperparasitica]
MNIRTATLADVPALANIAVTAMPDDPQWDYRFPYRLKYPEEHLAAIQNVYRSAVEDEASAGTVVKVLCNDKDEPMALSVWDLLYLGKASGGMANFAPNPNRPDASLVRMTAFLKAFQAAHDKYFDSVYGNKQIRLRVLCVHPDFRRRGAGEALCNWGFDLAKQEGVPVTIVASPMGKRLYARLGCEVLGEYEIRADGEDESCTEICMILRKELRAK